MTICSNTLNSNNLLKTVYIALITLLLVAPSSILAEEPTFTAGQSVNTEAQIKNEKKYSYNVVKVALEEMKVNRQAYLNNFWTSLGFFAVALGWILTSKDAKTFFYQHKWLRRSGIILVFVMFVVNIRVLIYTYDKSSELLATLNDINNYLLKEEDKLPALVVNYYEIYDFWLWVNGGIIAVIVAYLIYALHQTGISVSKIDEIKKTSVTSQKTNSEVHLDTQVES